MGHPTLSDGRVAFQKELEKLCERFCREWTITHGELVEVLFCQTLSIWHECQHEKCHDAPMGGPEGHIDDEPDWTQEYPDHTD